MKLKLTLTFASILYYISTYVVALLILLIIYEMTRSALYKWYEREMIWNWFENDTKMSPLKTYHSRECNVETVCGRYWVQGMDIQPLNFAYIWLLIKPYENEATLIGQNPLLTLIRPSIFGH